MIKLTKLNEKSFILNCDLIETVESTPDTVITTSSGKKYVVTESVEQIVEKVIEFKRRILDVKDRYTGTQ